jgi:hypothetical protein
MALTQRDPQTVSTEHSCYQDAVKSEIEQSMSSCIILEEEAWGMPSDDVLRSLDVTHPPAKVNQWLSQQPDTVPEAVAQNLNSATQSCSRASVKSARIVKAQQMKEAWLSKFAQKNKPATKDVGTSEEIDSRRSARIREAEVMRAIWVANFTRLEKGLDALKNPKTEPSEKESSCASDENTVPKKKKKKVIRPLSSCSGGSPGEIENLICTPPDTAYEITLNCDEEEEEPLPDIPHLRSGPSASIVSDPPSPQASGCATSQKETQTCPNKIIMDRDLFILYTQTVERLRESSEVLRRASADHAAAMVSSPHIHTYIYILTIDCHDCLHNMLDLLSLTFISILIMI